MPCRRGCRVGVAAQPPHPAVLRPGSARRHAQGESLAVKVSSTSRRWQADGGEGPGPLASQASGRRQPAPQAGASCRRSWRPCRALPAPSSKPRRSLTAGRAGGQGPAGPGACPPQPGRGRHCTQAVDGAARGRADVPRHGPLPQVGRRPSAPPAAAVQGAAGVTHATFSCYRQANFGPSKRGPGRRGRDGEPRAALERKIKRRHAANPEQLVAAWMQGRKQGGAKEQAWPAALLHHTGAPGEWVCTGPGLVPRMGLALASKRPAAGAPGPCTRLPPGRSVGFGDVLENLVALDGHSLTQADLHRRARTAVSLRASDPLAQVSATRGATTAHAHTHRLLEDGPHGRVPYPLRLNSGRGTGEAGADSSTALGRQARRGTGPGKGAGGSRVPAYPTHLPCRPQVLDPSMANPASPSSHSLDDSRVLQRAQDHRGKDELRHNRSHNPHGATTTIPPRQLIPDTRQSQSNVWMRLKGVQERRGGLGAGNMRSRTASPR